MSWSISVTTFGDDVLPATKLSLMSFKRLYSMKVGNKYQEVTVNGIEVLLQVPKKFSLV